MGFDLREAARKKILLVAHRGRCGGNIPCNTIAAYEIALRQGADMIEVDVDRSKDGKLFAFHPTMELPHLNSDLSIENLTSQEVKELRYVNVDHTRTRFSVEEFDEVLEHFKGRCFINVDKFGLNPEQIAWTIRQHGMEDQMLVKTTPDPDTLDVIQKYCPELPYMTMIREPQQWDAVLSRRLNVVGSEVLFKTEDHPFASKQYIEEEHANGRLVWCNAIVYDYKVVLAAGHNDDTAMMGDPEKGWGWIADQGYDFIQTDWMESLDHYLRATGRLMRQGR